jgi:hypothetical protein
MTSAIFGFIGVIVGALITGLKEWLFRQRDERQKGHYLAIRVCTMLDLFLYDCAEVVHDNGTVRGQSDPEGRYTPQVALPVLSFEPLAVDWQAIPSDLAYDVLSFPNRIQRALRYIEGAEDISGPPDYEEAFEARQDEFAKLGMRAAKIAGRLRTFAKLPDRERREWDPMESIENRVADIERREQERRGSWATMDLRKTHG